MTHDEAYVLMMEALDGTLTHGERLELESHLHFCLSCRQEWYTVQAIDNLFRQTPALSPAAGFAERTLARLPRSPYRLWVLAGLYLTLLLIGLLPLAIVSLIAGRLGSVVTNPTLAQSAAQLWQMIQAVLGAIGQGLGGLGAYVGEHPAVLGWLFLLAGLTFVWGGVYSQLVGQRRVA
ncbi:MAG: zf-HC2 domain-containing protein [Chloroflexota bacterium]